MEDLDNFEDPQSYFEACGPNSDEHSNMAEQPQEWIEQTSLVFSSVEDFRTWKKRSLNAWKIGTKSNSKVGTSSYYSYYNYKCTQHEACCAELKLKWNPFRSLWQVYFRGDHSGIPLATKKRGIASIFAEDIVSGLDVGKKPKAVLMDIRYKHRNDPHLQQMIPNPKQIRNLRYRMSQDVQNRLGMKYLSDISDWIDANMLDEATFASKGWNECIVLSRHTTEFEGPNGELMHSEGFVYSCRALLENMRRQQEGCGIDIGLSADATFNLVSQGWALYSVGCRNTRRNSEDLSQQYRPFAFLISRTERGDGYDVLFGSIKRCLVLMSMSNYSVRTFCIDHNDGCANAIKKHFPDATITLCWPHIKLNAIPKNASKLNDSNFKTTAQNDITNLHLARSTEQFDSLSQLMIASWQQCGEVELAEWFQREYLTPPFNRWSVTASGVPGCNCNNNPVESYHRNEKRAMDLQNPVSLGVFIHDKIPKQLVNNSIDLGSDPITIIPSGRYNRYVLERANELILHPSDKSPVGNYIKLKAAACSKLGIDGGYIFNSSNHLWQQDREYKMTPSRAARFLNAILGELQTSSFAEEVASMASMHLVRILASGQYQCDCAAFWHVRECSHVCASLHLDNIISLSRELETIHRAKLPGRPKNYIPVGYSANRMPVSAREECDAKKYIGTYIARRLGHHQRIYIGCIKGSRLTPTSSTMPQRILWMVNYKGGQFSDDEEDDEEELELNAVKEGMALLREQERLGRIRKADIPA